jgi:hypothetical protein
MLARRPCVVTTGHKTGTGLSFLRDALCQYIVFGSYIFAWGLGFLRVRTLGKRASTREVVLLLLPRPLRRRHRMTPCRVVLCRAVQAPIVVANHVSIPDGMFVGGCFRWVWRGAVSCRCHVSSPSRASHAWGCQLLVLVDGTALRICQHPLFFLLTPLPSNVPFYLQCGSALRRVLYTCGVVPCQLRGRESQGELGRAGAGQHLPQHAMHSPRPRGPRVPHDDRAHHPRAVRAAGHLAAGVSPRAACPPLSMVFAEVPWTRVCTWPLAQRRAGLARMWLPLHLRVPDCLRRRTRRRGPRRRRSCCSRRARRPTRRR